MAKDHGPSIKDNEQYEKLRKKGESKEQGQRPYVGPGPLDCRGRYATRLLAKAA